MFPLRRSACVLALLVGLAAAGCERKPPPGDRPLPGPPTPREVPRPSPQPEKPPVSPPLPDHGPGNGLNAP